MVSASIAIRSGDGVQIHAPSDARQGKNQILGPRSGLRFLNDGPRQADPRMEVGPQAPTQVIIH
jgi:hypothetical protein